MRKSRSDNTEISDKEVIRCYQTVDMIPQDVNSILEVGCGDGRVSTFVSRKMKLVGIDIDAIKIKMFPGFRINNESMAGKTPE
ncbi:MAG: class I SAM-dependent methyltransferase [Thermodesulfobacteriota bacterium]|nr:class I SAM-dependent methyltransferase [Thermodesulfobacteriota bacterium]